MGNLSIAVGDNPWINKRKVRGAPKVLALKEIYIFLNSFLATVEPFGLFVLMLPSFHG
jgi:hypothetical protein